MTYCLGMRLDEGLVLASDTRTNAGLDNIARFGKMRVFEQAGDRVLVALSAGNLSVTQNALNLLEKQAREQPDGATLWNVPSMDQAAGLLGEAMREVRERDEAYLREKNIDASASFILGGQIAGEPPRLFLVYSEGNYIEAMEETPYFQIGEIKYGKPVLDRMISHVSSLSDGVKCALLSFDATIRSNLSVGAPIDVLVYRTDSFCAPTQRRLAEDDPYLVAIKRSWDEHLHRAFEALPGSDW